VDGNTVYLQRAKIVKRDVIVPGTKIPASTIHKFRDGTYKMRETSIKKLSDLYHRYHEKKLRSKGLNKEDSRHYAKESPAKIGVLLSDYYRWAKEIKRSKKELYGQETPIHFIQYGMAHSDHDVSEWDEYIVQHYTKQLPGK
jgi:hypothetical protein